MRGIELGTINGLGEHITVATQRICWNIMPNMIFIQKLGGAMAPIGLQGDPPLSVCYVNIAHNQTR